MAEQSHAVDSCRAGRSSWDGALGTEHSSTRRGHNPSLEQHPVNAARRRTSTYPYAAIHLARDPAQHSAASTGHVGACGFAVP